MPSVAKLYVNSVVAAGLVMWVDGFARWKMGDPAQFLTYLILAAMAATWRLPFSGLPAAANCSAGILVVIAGIADLSLPQMLVISSTAALVESLWKPKVPLARGRVMLPLAASAISVVLAHDVAFLPVVSRRNCVELTVLIGTGVFLAAHTGLICGALAMIEDQPFRAVARAWIAGTAPYYLAGAGIGALTGHLSSSIDWRSALSVLAPMFVLYMYYRHLVERRA